MNYRNFEIQTITGFIEVPCQNSNGIDLRRTNDASNFARHVKKSIHTVKDICVYVEETTATIQVTVKPTHADSDYSCQVLGHLLASMFIQFR
jgi:pyruvate/oxaloacetate carboxyltransferase